MPQASLCLACCSDISQNKSHSGQRGPALSRNGLPGQTGQIAVNLTGHTTTGSHSIQALLANQRCRRHGEALPGGHRHGPLYLAD